MSTLLTRRRLIGSLGTGAGLMLSGCDKIAATSTGKTLLGLGERLTYRAQRVVQDRSALAVEYAPADMSLSSGSTATPIPRPPTFSLTPYRASWTGDSSSMVSWHGR